MSCDHEAAVGMMELQAKKRQRLPANHQELGRGKDECPLGLEVKNAASLAPVTSWLHMEKWQLSL